MRFDRKILITLILLSVLAVACGNSDAPATQDVNAIYTSAIGSMVASFFDTQTALAPTSTAIPSPTIPPPPSNTFIPSPSASATYAYLYPAWTNTPYFTPSPTGTLNTPTVDPSLLAFGCNNLAFITDVTIPSGTILTPRQNFTKTWKVANTGTCPWLYQYSLLPLSGSSFDAGPTKLGRLVEAGHWADVSINMDAPKSEGTYTSYWRMADANGDMFGASLMVSFVVAKPTSVLSSTPAPSLTSTAAPTDTSTLTPTP